MEIILGSDELILWLRKNKKAIGITNAVLGHKISDLIHDLGGKLEKEVHPSIWSEYISGVAMAKLEIPATSGQYQVDTKILPEIFERISTW
jgi:hypothetical protein